MRLVLRDQTVVAARQLAELFVSLLEELENRLGEVVPAGDDALHVMLLVLNRTEEHGVREIDHARDAAAPGTEENTLALGRTVDHVVGRTEEFPNQRRFVLVKRPFEMGGQEAILDIHSG